MREDGFRFDRMVMTGDSNYSPTGTGPAESTRSGGEPPANTAPTVDAGDNATVIMTVAAAGVVLDATVSDDGLPGGGLTHTWSRISGPDTAAFSDTGTEDPTVTFPATGIYEFNLNVDDSELDTDDTVQITVT
eukprot:UN14605